MKDIIIDTRNRELVSVYSISSPRYAKNDFKGILILHGELVLRSAKLAQEIQNDYKGKKLVLLGVLDGSVHFIKDLSEGIALPLQRTFIKVSSYRGGVTSGELEFQLNPMIDLNNKDVLIVEDIIDSGKTMYYLMEEINKKFNPRSVQSCVLLDKRDKRLERYKHIEVDYTGFYIKDEFVVGYGLDYMDNYRGYRHIAILKREVFMDRDKNE